MDMEKTGTYLASLRRGRDMTQQQVADILGVSNKTVSKWESGAGLPDIAALPALAALYGVTADDILAGETRPRACADTPAEVEAYLERRGSLRFRIGYSLAVMALAVWVAFPYNNWSWLCLLASPLCLWLGWGVCRSRETLRRRILLLIPLCALWLFAAIQLLGVWRLLVSAYALHGGVVRQFSWAVLTVRQEAVWLLLPLLLAVGSAFIWDFEVTGNDTVPTESVLQALERCGVRVGTRGVGLDQDELRNRVLPLLPDVVYLAVNVRGCTAHVQVVERVRPPHLYRDCDVQNIVAARDGLITKIEALDGVTCAAVGETVQAGQVLLSGVADSPRGCRYMRATGRIWARTWYEWTVPVPLETVLKDGTEPVKTRTHTALDLGRHRIALPAGDSILQGRENCDKIIRYRGVQFPFGLRLPVTLVTETVAERAVYHGERPEDEARAEGQKQLEAQLAQTIGDDGRVLKADVSARRQGAYLMVTLRAECEEQIGVDAPLTITSDTGR